MRGEEVWGKLLRLSRTRAACLLLALPIALGIWRAMSSRSAAIARIAEPAERRALFALIVANEPTLRREVVKDFPADAWSQDDAFHEREYQRTRTVASNRGVRLIDALVGLDDGLRASHGRFRATVPPCRPRTIY